VNLSILHDAVACMRVDNVEGELHCSIPRSIALAAQAGSGAAAGGVGGFESVAEAGKGKGKTLDMPDGMNDLVTEGKMEATPHSHAFQSITTKFGPDHTLPGRFSSCDSPLLLEL